MQFNQGKMQWHLLYGASLPSCSCIHSMVQKGASLHSDDEIFFNAYLLHTFLRPNDMPMISNGYAKETYLSLMRDDKSTRIGYLSTIRVCEWERDETRKTRICDVSYPSQLLPEKDGLRQEKYAEETSCC